MNNSDIKYVVLHVTSWIGYGVATHFYGRLILATRGEVETVSDWEVRHLGDEQIEVHDEMTEQEAIEMDESSSEDFKRYHQLWKSGDKNTYKFLSIPRTVEAGYKRFKELGLNVPFVITLYNSDSVYKIDDFKK